MTTYIVLRRDETAGTFAVLKPNVEANTDKEAIRKAVKGLDFDGSGEFVAVPARSFRTRKLLRETVQRELFEA
jgi:hypothetical protein